MSASESRLLVFAQSRAKVSRAKNRARARKIRRLAVRPTVPAIRIFAKVGFIGLLLHDYEIVSRNRWNGERDGTVRVCVIERREKKRAVTKDHRTCCECHAERPDGCAADLNKYGRRCEV